MRCYLLLIAICAGCSTSPPTATKILSAEAVVLSDGTKIRYAGLAGPTTDNPWFEFCRQANHFLVQGKTVKIVVEPDLSNDEEDVAYVYTPIQIGEKTKYLFVNAEMVRFGLSKVLPLPNQCKRKDLWQSLLRWQEEVKPKRWGLWSGGKPPQQRFAPLAPNSQQPPTKDSQP